MYGGLKHTKCEKCNRLITVCNIKKHLKVCSKNKKSNKIRGIDYDPNWGYKAGIRTTWNKGLKFVPDLRDSRYIGTIGGYREGAGRSKKFKVFDSYCKEVVLQSSYELICSQILNKLKIKWIRPKCLYYDNNRRYYPDFYLPDLDIYLDPKNDYKIKLDEEKINKVKQQNNIKLYVINKNQLNDSWFCSLVGKTSD
jgi:hypothetical protein